MELLASPFRDNQARNTAYLMFLDLDRMLRPFRLNYGLPSSAQPCGGWERPTSEIRGHTTGHLMSALALTYATTGNPEALARGRYLVGQLAAMQARARQAGFHPGYLSAFPESFFDLLEEGRPVWSPYYMIHKYLAGLIDQYQLAGDARRSTSRSSSATGWTGARPGCRTRRCRWCCRTSSAACRRRWPTCTRSPAGSGTWPPRSGSTTRRCSTRWPTGWTSWPGCRRT